jgi:hypothetical protein
MKLSDSMNNNATEIKNATAGNDVDYLSEKFMKIVSDKVDAAISSNDPIEIAKMQLEVQWLNTQYLKNIDWKMWQFYRILKI